jgi:hypothetical protein
MIAATPGSQFETSVSVVIALAVLALDSTLLLYLGVTLAGGLDPGPTWKAPSASRAPRCTLHRRYTP